MKTDLGASIRARLLNKAKADGVDFNQILVRFALERFLYRISQSAHSEFYVLKGALLFTLWYDMPHRATRDADFLGFGASDLESIRNAFREIASIAVLDGIQFDPDSVTVEEIRKEAGYAGVRVLIGALLDGARCKTQVDIGFGDAVKRIRCRRGITQISQFHSGIPIWVGPIQFISLNTCVPHKVHDLNHRIIWH